MNKKTAGMCVAGAGVLWGIISLFVNPLGAFGVSSMEMGFLRFFVCAVVMLLAVLLVNPSLLKIKLRDAWVFLGSGVLSLTFFSWCYFTTMITAEVSVAVSLLYTSPVWVMIFSALLFKEKLNAKKLIAIIATVAGCFCVSGMLSGAQTLTVKSFFIGIGAGIGYALYSVFGRIAIEKDYGSMTITFYTFLFAAFGFAFFVKPSELVQKCVAEPKIIALSIASAILCGVMPYVLYTIGLKHLEASSAAIIVAVEPLVGCLIGFIVYKESAGVLKIIGIALILGSIVLLNLPERVKAKHSSKEIK